MRLKYLLLILFVPFLLAGSNYYYGAVSSTVVTYEDFTTYTESDEGSDIGIAENTITWTNLESRRDTGIVYKDQGANYFDSDFTHQFVATVTARTSATIVSFWKIAGNIGDIVDLKTATNQFTGVAFQYPNPEHRFILFSCEGSTWLDVYDVSSNITVGTTYYLTVSYDRDGGANGTGQFVCTIRTVSHTGTVFDTLTIDQSAAKQHSGFRYNYVTSTYDDAANASTVSGTVSNLTLSP